MSKYTPEKVADWFLGHSNNDILAKKLQNLV